MTEYQLEAEMATIRYSGSNRRIVLDIKSRKVFYNSRIHWPQSWIGDGEWHGVRGDAALTYVTDMTMENARY